MAQPYQPSPSGSCARFSAAQSSEASSNGAGGHVASGIAAMALKNEVRLPACSAASRGSSANNAKRSV
jgi:hypothetical protein